LPALEIRTAEEGDVAALTPLFEQLGYPTEPPEIQVRLQAFEDDSTALVAVAEGGLLGFVAVSITSDFIVGRRALILGLVVADGARSQGIGAALLDAAEIWAVRRGATLIGVRSNVVRGGAHRFYERHGYWRIKSQHVFEKRRAAVSEDPLSSDPHS
jgi:GNAT superfamily N-acetyltransferase